MSDFHNLLLARLVSVSDSLFNLLPLAANPAFDHNHPISLIEQDLVLATVVPTGRPIVEEI